MRNRTNLFCAMIWAFNAGVNLVVGNVFVMALSAAAAGLYGHSAWVVAREADKQLKKEKTND